MKIQNTLLKNLFIRIFLLVLFQAFISNLIIAQENDSTKTKVGKDTSQSNITTATVGVSMTATQEVKEALANVGVQGLTVQKWNHVWV